MTKVVEWRPLDSKKLNQPSSEDVEGIQIKSYVSPYDVPEAIRVSSFPDKDHILIEFSYMGGEEELESEIKEQQIKLLLGRDSRRLYGLDFDRRQAEAEVVNKILDRLSSEPHRPPRKGNYELVKKVLLSLFASSDSPLANPAQ